VNDADTLSAWAAFWGTAIADLVVPPHPVGFDRLLVIARGTTIDAEFERCRRLFLCRSYVDGSLDVAVCGNDRDARRTAYAVWVRDRIEADEEWRGRSADDLVKAQVAGITLLERLVYERKYFDETGLHLDHVAVTLCSGSRGAHARVPRVDWDDHDDHLYLEWCAAADAQRLLGARQVAPARG
jgi:hypothetical protein